MIHWSRRRVVLSLRPGLVLGTWPVRSAGVCTIGALGDAGPDDVLDGLLLGLVQRPAAT